MVFSLNPQWQSSQQGLLKAWEYVVEILVPPAWTVKVPMVERSRDVATFRLMLSEATFQCTLILLTILICISSEEFIVVGVGSDVVVV